MNKDKIINLLKKFYAHYSEYFQDSLTNKPEWTKDIEVGLGIFEKNYDSLLALIENRDSFSDRLYDLFIKNLGSIKILIVFKILIFPILQNL